MCKNAFHASLFLLAILVTGLAPEQSCIAGWFGPSNYDECILDSMKGTTGDLAAQLIAKSCRKKFPVKPEPVIPSRDLSSDKISQITGRAGISYGNSYSGNLYNGNSGVTVTQVTLSISCSIAKKNVTRNYYVDVNIPPLTTKDFTISIVAGDAGAEYTWSVISAKGY